MLAAAGFGVLGVTQVEPAVLAAFDCGDVGLNHFLAEQAHEFHENRLGFTTVVFHSEHVEGPVGFFTLSADGIQFKQSELFELNISQVELRYISAIKIGRLGVAVALHGQQIGRQLIDFARAEALRYPARVLVVDAADGVTSFYESCGFQPALFAESRKDAGSRSTKMWLDLSI